MAPAPRSLFAPVLLLLTLSLAAGAGAQLAPVSLSMAGSDVLVTLDPGDTRQVTVELTNQGTLDGTVDLEAALEGTGWTAQLSASQVDLPAGDTETVTLSIAAPADRNTSSGEATVVLDGVLTAGGGQFSDSAQLSIGSVLAPAPPPAPEPFPWIPVIGGAVVLIGVAFAVAAVIYTKRREAGIKIALPAQVDAPVGRETFVPLRVLNESGRPRIAQVEARRVPKGWKVATNLSSVPLEPHESEDLWLAVVPGSEDPSEEVYLGVAAKPAEAKTWRSQVEIQVRVLGLHRRSVVPGAGEMELEALIEDSGRDA